MLLTRPPLSRRIVRLACVRPAASVRSEPGSNSQVELTLILSNLNHCVSLRSLTSSHTADPKTNRMVVYKETANISVVQAVSQQLSKITAACVSLSNSYNVKDLSRGDRATGGDNLISLSKRAALIPLKILKSSYSFKRISFSSFCFRSESFISGSGVYSRFLFCVKQIF